MKRMIGAVAVLGGMLVIGNSLIGQDAASQPKRFRGVLPAYWGKLGLSDEQKQEVYKAQAQYKDKIDALEKQIKDLKKSQRSDMFKVLTSAQKARLKELILKKIPEDTPKPKKTPDKE